MGGGDSSQARSSTELVSLGEPSSQPGSPLLHSRFAHCSISLEGSVVLTGGLDSPALVTQYTTGQGEWRPEELPVLVTPRYRQATAPFFIYLVLPLPLPLNLPLLLILHLLLPLLLLLLRPLPQTRLWRVQQPCQGSDPPSDWWPGGGGGAGQY